MGHGWPTKQPYINNISTQNKVNNYRLSCTVMTTTAATRKWVVLKVGNKGGVGVKLVKNFEWWCVKMGSGSQNGR
jgi:hypothetical protein